MAFRRKIPFGCVFRFGHSLFELRRYMNNSASIKPGRTRNRFRTQQGLRQTENLNMSDYIH